MNITFTIMAHGFEKAAKVEKALKDIGVPYETAIAKSVNAPKKKRAVIDRTKLAIVITAIDKHPDRNDYEIGRETGIGHNTVNRIRNGKHCLQRKPTQKQIASLKQVKK